MEGVIAAIMVVLTGTLFLVWRMQVGRRGQWRPLFREGTWLRAMGWTAALAAAAAIGSLLSGERDIALLSVTVGGVVLMVLVGFWSYARTFGDSQR